ncbi:SH3 domain-containing protein [Ammoniphilus sp. YIM 78166]|uniref:SH3 domain-containing protein n=1 Tax=Ammoniphilus sp. YIM 78166 TaxID=1644106 RepID=UPI00142F7E03|nr:SH3 domain-containing protein [Ammoniphilus sp. YIM 78166]
MAVLSNSQQAGSVTIAVSSLNVRDGAGQTHKVIAQVKGQENYPIVQMKDNWIQILLPNGQKGWVASWHVEINQPATPAAYVSPTIETLNIRAGPSTSFPVVGQMAKSESFPRLDAEGDWIKIRLKDGSIGWTAGWLTKEVPSPALIQPAPNPSSQAQATVKSATLNVRSGPGTHESAVGQVYAGDSLTILEQQGDWIRIQKDNLQGWVASWLVTMGSTPSPPSPSVESEKPTIRILNPGTNLRSGPGTSFDVVKIAKEGENYAVLGVEGDWFRIQTAPNQVGYVAGWIVSAQGVANVERKGNESLLKGRTILVDPGHGGSDSGAIGPHLGTLEKVVNLQVSHLLSRKLKAAGATVIMTREDDRKVSLQERVDSSIRRQVDAFISIHHNTSENYRVNGVITYFYSNGDDRELANSIQKEVVKRTGSTDLNARYGNYFVLRENPQLAVLCELGFLTNYQEEVIMKTKEFQEQAAEGVFQGIVKYFAQKK